MTRRLVALVCVVLALWLLGGCSSAKKTYRQYVPEKDKIDYKRAKTINELEVPPDLTSESIDAGMVVPDVEPTPTATYSDYSRERRDTRPVRSGGVMPEQEKIRIQRDQDDYWLVVAAPANEVWPTMRDFWLQAGFLIKKQDPRIGILETEWAENRADIPQDIIRRTIGKVIDPVYSAGTRDKFRVRLERGAEPGTTEVYLTHYGAEEVIEGATDDETAIWKPRPSDPELEVEMLRRMAVYMGAEDERARTMAAQATEPEAVRARLTETGAGTTLSLDDEFPRAWRRTGVALDRIGFTVEDRDRSKGIYYVRYIDLSDEAAKEEGWLDRLRFWGEDDAKTTRYQVSLNEASPHGTRVTVLNEQGEPEQSRSAYRILSLLQEQLK